MKQAAQDNSIAFTIFNSTGFGLTGASMVSLLALTYGASDTQMSLLYSGVYLMNFTALLVPLFLSGCETTAILKGAIWCRGLCTVFFPALFLLPDPQIRVWGVIAIYLSFLFARGIGMSAFSPVYKAICSSRDLPAFLGRMFSMFNFGILLSSTLCFFVLEYLVGTLFWLEEEHAFLLLLLLGILLNLGSGWRISKLPATGYMEDGSFTGLLQAFQDVFTRSALRGVVVLSILQTAMAIIAAFMMSHLKNVVLMSAGRIFLLTAIGYIAGILIAQGFKVVGVRISSRALVFSAHGFLFFIGLFWAYAGSLGIHSTAGYALLYGLSAIGLSASGNVVLKIQTGSLPETRGILVNIVYQVATTLAALLAIGCARVLLTTFPDADNPYAPVFFFMSLLSILIVMVSVVHLRTKGEGGFFEDLSMLSPANLFNIIRLYRNEEGGSSLQRHMTEGVMMRPTHASRAVLAEWMNSSDLMQRLSALRTLNHTHTPELFEVVYAEAHSPDSPLRFEAITALGFMANRGATELLYEALKDPLPRIRATAIKSLFRLGEVLPDDEVFRTYQTCQQSGQDNRTILEILVGVTVGGRRALLYRILASELARHPGIHWSQTLLVYAAELEDRRATMQEMLNEEKQQCGEGVNYLLAEFESALPENLADDDLRALFASGHYEELATRLRRHADAEWIILYDRTTALGVLLLWYLNGVRERGKPGGEVR